MQHPDGLQLYVWTTQSLLLYKSKHERLIPAQKNLRVDLPQQARPDLDHARATGISLRESVGDDAGAGSTVERDTGIARVEDVEDVNCIAANLKFRSFINSDVAED